MGKDIIRCKNVSIRYIVGDFKDIGFKEFLLRKLKNNYKIESFWADKNINFSLEKGDMLGVIGTNGAGKSTLLKAISGVMLPTEGRIETHGSIAALLELSTGFDGDLTVKENVYLRGALLGYSKEFIESKYKTIIEFAELKEFTNRKFNQLSSGMKSRLAFSIACLVNPDIVILDEVLAVGDGSFRKKSKEKMKEILMSGVTGVFVSHSTDQIRELCNKVLWIDHGNQIVFSSDVDIYLNAYEEFLITGILPKNHKEAEELSNNYINRIAISKEEKRKQKITKIEKYINDGSDVAIEAAINIIKSNKPELLK